MAETVKWLELERDRRRHIARAVRKGRAADDPRDAPYALPGRRLDELTTYEHTTLIEEDALAALKGLNPRSRLQKNFVAWREYEVELDVWVVGELASGDYASASLGIDRIESTRDHSGKLARRLGARICARA